MRQSMKNDSRCPRFDLKKTNHPRPFFSFPSLPTDSGRSIVLELFFLRQKYDNVSPSHISVSLRMLFGLRDDGKKVLGKRISHINGQHISVSSRETVMTSIYLKIGLIPHLDFTRSRLDLGDD